MHRYAFWSLESISIRMFWTKPRGVLEIWRGEPKIEIFRHYRVRYRCVCFLISRVQKWCHFTKKNQKWFLKMEEAGPKILENLYFWYEVFRLKILLSGGRRGWGNTVEVYVYSMKLFYWCTLPKVPTLLCVAKSNGLWKEGGLKNRSPPPVDEWKVEKMIKFQLLNAFFTRAHSKPT